MVMSTNQHARQERDQQNGDRVIGFFWPSCFILMGCVLLILSFAVARAVKRSNEFAVLVELKQLEQALKSYQNEYGTYPPNAGSEAFEAHLGMRLNGHELAEGTRIVDSLDENEVLLFWLGNVAASVDRDDAFYVVDQNRTTDIDGDGFREYNRHDGLGVFILRDGQVMSKQNDTGEAFTANEFQQVYLETNSLAGK